MTKSYRELRNKMSSAAQKKAEGKTLKMLDEMPLYELRRALLLSQVELAKELGIEQPAVSKLEHRTDMFISTLRKMVEAMGGQLEITAKFPQGAVKINQFCDFSKKAAI